MPPAPREHATGHAGATPPAHARAEERGSAPATARQSLAVKRGSFVEAGDNPHAGADVSDFTQASDFTKARAPSAGRAQLLSAAALPFKPSTPRASAESGGARGKGGRREAVAPEKPKGVWGIVAGVRNRLRAAKPAYMGGGK